MTPRYRSACEDPDAYFCTWWAKWVWLGAPKRKLPRTPAVFDRKTKWRFAEPTDDLHSAAPIGGDSCTFDVRAIAVARP